MRWRKWLGLAVGVLLLLALVGVLKLHHSLPEGEVGPEAEQLADALMARIGCEAWEQMPFVAWTFKGTRTHYWDRSQHRVRSEFDGYVTVLILGDHSGWVSQDGTLITGESQQQVLERAYSAFINDSFWLNPFCTIRNSGTKRERVTIGNESALLVTYESGGVTPGDKYLILFDERGLPRAWRMWVQILPVGGLETSWEAWHQLPDQVWVSGRHKLGPLNLTLEVLDITPTENLWRHP
ncbi:MAG: hypothetical protein KDC35_20480 [Acidobacteria bacterium]|nr:hypothetical protein [Acidobacteriota bacterium]